MLKKDLKTGYLVQIRDGSIALVMLGTDNGDVISNGYPDHKSDVENENPQPHTWGPLDCWDDDLRYTNGISKEIKIIPEADIMKIWNCGNGIAYMARMSTFHRTLLFERKE